MDINQEDPPKELIEENPAVRKTPGKILEAPGKKNQNKSKESVESALVNKMDPPEDTPNPEIISKKETAMELKDTAMDLKDMAMEQKETKINLKDTEMDLKHHVIDVPEE